MILASFLADTAPSATNELGPFVPYLNLGVIVVILGLAYTRRVRFYGEVEEKDQEIAELKATVKQYIEHYQKEVLPALIDVTKVSGEVIAFLNKHRD